jgi:hypothetical protein
VCVLVSFVAMSQVSSCSSHPSASVPLTKTLDNSGEARWLRLEDKDGNWCSSRYILTDDVLKSCTTVGDFCKKVRNTVLSRQGCRFHTFYTRVCGVDCVQAGYLGLVYDLMSKPHALHPDSSLEALFALVRRTKLGTGFVRVRPGADARLPVMTLRALSQRNQQKVGSL